MYDETMDTKFFVQSVSRDVHYGTFSDSEIFFLNPEYRILFWNNLLGGK